MLPHPFSASKHAHQTSQSTLKQNLQTCPATSEYRQSLVQQRCSSEISSSHAESSSAPSATARVENVYGVAANTACTTASTINSGGSKRVPFNPAHAPASLLPIKTHAPNLTINPETKFTNLSSHQRILPILDSAAMLQQDILEPR